MRTFAVPALLFLIAIAVACQDTPQPLAVDSAAPGLMNTVIEGNIANDGQDYVGRIIVITDPRPNPTTHCGVIYNAQDAAIINPGAGPATVTVVGMDQTASPTPGDRFEILTQTPCDARLKLTMTRK